MDQEKKRFLLLIGSLVALCAVVAVIVVVWHASGSDDNEKTEFSVSSLDQKKAQNVADKFTVKSGRFGVDKSQVHANSIRDVSHMIERQETHWTDYYTPREQAYDTLDQYIATDGPLDYSSVKTAEWEVPSERKQLSSFETTRVDATAHKNGKYMTVQGKKYRSVHVDVDFDSIQQKRVATAEDSSWDGSYKVLQKKFRDNTMQLNMVQTKNGDWKVYSMSTAPKNIFLLSVWENPSDDMYSSSQFHFEKINTLRPDNKPGEE